MGQSGDGESRENPRASGGQEENGSGLRKWECGWAESYSVTFCANQKRLHLGTQKMSALIKRLSKLSFSGKENPPI